eukprot:441006_1
MLVLVHALPNPTPAPNAVITFLAAVPFPPGESTTLAKAPIVNPAATYIDPLSTIPFCITLFTAFSDDASTILIKDIVVVCSSPSTKSTLKDALCLFLLLP